MHPAISRPSVQDDRLVARWTVTSHASSIALVFAMLQPEETQLASWEFQTAPVKTSLFHSLLASPMRVIHCPFLQLNKSKGRILIMEYELGKSQKIPRMGIKEEWGHPSTQQTGLGPP